MESALRLAEFGGLPRGDPAQPFRGEGPSIPLLTRCETCSFLWQTIPHCRTGTPVSSFPSRASFLFDTQVGSWCLPGGVVYIHGFRFYGFRFHTMQHSLSYADGATHTHAHTGPGTNTPHLGGNGKTG